MSLIIVLSITVLLQSWWETKNPSLPSSSDIERNIEQDSYCACKSSILSLWFWSNHHLLFFFSSLSLLRSSRRLQPYSTEMENKLEEVGLFVLIICYVCQVRWQEDIESPQAKALFYFTLSLSTAMGFIMAAIFISILVLRIVKSFRRDKTPLQHSVGNGNFTSTGGSEKEYLLQWFRQKGKWKSNAFWFKGKMEKTKSSKLFLSFFVFFCWCSI